MCEDVGDVYKIRIGYENPQGTPGGYIETVWNMHYGFSLGNS